jgi:hypothetical protein
MQLGSAGGPATQSKTVRLVMPQHLKSLHAEFVLDRMVARIVARMVARIVAQIVAQIILLLVH